MPPLDMPEMIYFRAKRKMMIIGMTTIVEAAIIRSLRCPPSVMNAYRPNGSVLTSLELVAIIGHRKEFQVAIEFSRMMVARDDFAIGTMTLHRYFQSEQPSTFAA